MLLVYFILSLSILLLSIGLTVYLITKKAKSINPLYILMGGVFASVCFLLFPFYYMEFKGNFLPVIKALFVSMHDAIQYYTADSNFADLTQNLAALSGWLKLAYSFLGATLIILAPALTFSFVLSLFKGITEHIKYIFHSKANTYVFSQINEQSICLAESIRERKFNSDKNSNKYIIIFANNEKKRDELDEDLWLRMRKINAFFFKKEISALHLKKPSAEQKLQFFVLSDNESENLSQTLKLSEKYKGNKNVKLFLFSNNVTSELMLNNLDTGNMFVRRVNPINSLVNYFLLNNGADIFNSAIPLDQNNKHISALVVGLGELGTEILKSLSWYCQMDGYTLSINAFDKDENAHQRLLAECPELIGEQYNGVYYEGEAFYNINIHSLDVSSWDFISKIKDISSISYVFVSLGDDTFNIKTAVNLRIVFEQMGIHPKIVVKVTDSDKKEALQGAKNHVGTPYDIDFVGDTKTLYSKNIIINKQLEDEALELHKRYNKGNPYGFYEFEYNYKSSVSSTLHQYAKRHCDIPGSKKTESELTKEERDILEPIEHKRWNAYMRSQGYVYSGSPERESRNELGKMHNNLVVFDCLTDEDKQKDSRVATK